MEKMMTAEQKEFAKEMIEGGFTPADLERLGLLHDAAEEAYRDLADGVENALERASGERVCLKDETPCRAPSELYSVPDPDNTVLTAEWYHDERTDRADWDRRAEEVRMYFWKDHVVYEATAHPNLTAENDYKLSGAAAVIAALAAHPEELGLIHKLFEDYAQRVRPMYQESKAIEMW